MNNLVLKSNSAFCVIGEAPAWTTSNETGYLFPLVQSSDVSLNIDRQTIKQIGSQNYAINDVMRSPDVSFNTEYYLSPYLANEFLLGFQGNTASYLPACANLRERNQNIYLVIDNKNGEDAFSRFKQSPAETNFSGFSCVGIGNAFLTNYSISFAVGAIPKATASFVASNLQFDNLTGNTIKIPAINLMSGDNVGAGSLDFTSLRNTLTGKYIVSDVEGRTEYNAPVAVPYNTQISLENLQIGDISLSGTKPILQSFDMSLSLDRQAMYGLGSNYVYGRKLQLPIQGTASLSAIVQSITGGSISGLFTNESGYSLEVSFADQFSKETGFLKIENAKLESVSHSMPVNGMMQFTANYSFQATETGGLYMKVKNQSSIFFAEFSILAGFGPA